MMKNLVLYLTKVCNLNCKYCFVNKSDGKLTLDRYINIIKKYHDEIKSVIFFGGEPLLEFPLIKKIIEYNKTQKYNFNYTINTNCILLSDEKINFVNENNILINGSLDGNLKSNSQNRFGKAIFDKIVNNLSEKKINNLILNYVITPNNIRFFKESLMFMKEKGFNDICLMINYEAKWSIDDINFFKKQLYECENIFLEATEEFKLYPIYNKLSCIFDNTEIKKCNFGNENLIVSSDGKVYPCMSFVDDENFELIDGKTFKNTVRVKKCKGCQYSNLCVNNCMCRYRDIKLKNDIDVNCEFEKIFIDFSYYIAKKMIKF